jgi:hypothetical protein
LIIAPNGVKLAYRTRVEQGLARGKDQILPSCASMFSFLRRHYDDHSRL